MPQDNIYIKGAREHNLKNIDVSIPRNKLVLIAGLSREEVVARVRYALR